MTFEFRRPPTPDAITPALLAETSDDVLENVLLNYVLEIRHRFPDLLETLPRGLQGHYVAFIVDAEVLNGGFNQLLFNSPEVARDAPAALTFLGVAGAADLAARAWNLYEDVRVCHESARAADTIEAFMATYDESPFEHLDECYAERQEEWRLARLRYIREHPEEFLHDRGSAP